MEYVPSLDDRNYLGSEIMTKQFLRLKTQLIKLNAILNKEKNRKSFRRKKSSFRRKKVPTVQATSLMRQRVSVLIGW